MNCSMLDFPVHHELPEFTQTHVHQVSDAIQPSHPLSSPSPPAPNPSQHQGLSQRVNSSHEVAKVLGVSASASVLPMNTQDWSPLGWTGWISLLPYKSLTPKQCSFRIPVTHSTNISVLEFWKMNIKAREILLILILALFKGSVITTSEVCTLCLI